jgi:Spy/CpxP family protein refolding chaperone
MQLSRLTAVFYLTLVFGAGIAVGALGHRYYAASPVNATAARPNPEQYRQRYMDEMKTRLGLSPEQAAKLEAILDETRARFKEHSERMRPEVMRIRAEQVEKVRAILNDAQREEYEKMRAERDSRERERHKKGDGFRGPPPGL